MLLFSVERLELLIFVDLREYSPIVENLEGDPRVAAVPKKVRLSIVVHFLHADQLLVPRWLADFPPFALVVLDFFRVVHAQLTDRLLVLRRLVHLRGGEAILFKFMARRCM